MISSTIIACACCLYVIPKTTPTPNVMTNTIPKVTSFGYAVMMFIISDFNDIVKTMTTIVKL